MQGKHIAEIRYYLDGQAGINRDERKIILLYLYYHFYQMILKSIKIK